MAKPAHIYEFGPFQLDTGAHRLLKEKTPVSLQPKSFDLLQVLIENQGRAMSKSELLEALWPVTHVDEGNLTFQVSVLRKALGPDAGSWIETIPRYGYRFSAPVVIHPLAEVPAPAPAVSLAPKRTKASPPGRDVVPHRHGRHRCCDVNRKSPGRGWIDIGAEA